jgi:hypothetical protein
VLQAVVASTAAQLIVHCLQELCGYAAHHATACPWRVLTLQQLLMGQASTSFLHQSLLFSSSSPPKELSRQAVTVWCLLTQKNCRSSLQGKTSWPCYSLTAKALENITAGAKRSSSFEPELTQQEQQLQQLLQEALSSSIKTKAAGSSSSGRQSAPPSQQQCPASQQQQGEEQQGGMSQQQLYQQLSAVLLLQYVAKAAALPEQEAWQLLVDYQPELPEQQQQQQMALQDMQQQLAGMQLDDQQLLAALAAAAGGSDAASQGASQGAAAAAAAGAAAAGSAGSNCTESKCMIYELQDAAVQDGDDEVYEALEDMKVPAVASSSTAAEQQQQQYSWPVLQQKLCSLAEHVHYSLLGYEPLWQEQQAAQHLLQLLRALGVHSHSDDLQPVLHAYVGLLVDRLAAVPADLPLLQQLWEALGLTGGQGVGFKASSTGSSKQQALPSEAVLGFSVAASVWGQLPGANSRGKLWRLMYDNLLPQLEQCIEQLAYNAASSSSSRTKQQQQQQQQAAVQGEGFAHALLLCHVVELLLLGRPGAVDVAGQLVQRGVMRSLVVLFGQHAGNAAAEPIRCVK